jgi:hypothetical protein
MTEIITTDVQADTEAENALMISVILPKINILREALLAQAPEIANHLKEINEDLRQYPDLVHLLSDDDIAPIYSAIMEQSNVEITAKAAKKKTTFSDSDKNLLNSLL